MATPGNLSEQILAVPEGAGSVQSSGQTFQADPYTGTGRYAVPIQVEAGPAGIAPSLALSYSTHAGQGSAGLGWSLGLASIQRRTDKGLPTYDDDVDTFALQGDELIHVGAGVYRQRIEGRFARIQWVRQAGRNYWVVTERDGTRVFYGVVDNERLHDGNGRIASWYASKKQDVHGNEVNYVYERDAQTRDVRLQEVTWAGCYRVALSYETRPDVLRSHKVGFQHLDDHRLKRVDVQVRRSSNGEFATYRQYELAYDVSDWTGRSLLHSVTVTGFDDTGNSRVLPSLSFDYLKPDPEGPVWRTVSGAVPGDSLRGRNLTLVRQSGSGLPDILETRATGHYLRVNLGDGRFERPVRVASPASVALADSGTFISDMDGDGFGDLVVNGGTRVYRAAKGGGWGDSYRSASRPAVDLDDPSVRLADLTGDGLPDLLENTVRGWLWYPNEGEGQWGIPVAVLGAPPVRLDDPRVHLVDVTGDGLADIVQVLDRSITVWPSKGRGQFGEAFVLAGAPDLSDARPEQIRFVDITGSGQADLVVTHASTIDLYLYHSGQRLAPRRTLGGRRVSSDGFVEVVDLFGAGAMGLLFTDEAGGSSSWRFLEVFPGGAPDLLDQIDNGLGAQTRLAYTSSSAEWARDKAAGRPWKSHMPSSQRVVQSVTTEDTVTGNVLGVQYRYHHGVYDGAEREFRGFAQVEQLDREAPRDELHPIAQARVVRWYNTGLELDLASTFAPNPRGALQGDALPPTPWARRSLRGTVYREETYALDDNSRPYVISETGYRVFPLQQQPGTGRYSFAPVPVRTRTTHSERSHDLDHRVTETEATYDLHSGLGYGLPVMQRERGYGRLGTFSTDHEQQQQADLERYTVTSYLHRDVLGDVPDPASEDYTPNYIVGKPREVSRFGVESGGDVLLSRERIYYDGSAFVGGLEVTKGLMTRRMVLALTDGLISSLYPSGSGVTPALVAASYVEEEANEHWIAAERVDYAANGQVVRSVGPTADTSTGETSDVTYDSTYSLFPISAVDPLGHPTTLTRGEFPHQVTRVVDANGNHTDFAYDPSGMPKSKSVMGKPDGTSWTGDPPTHPTEVYEYDFNVTPVQVIVRSRQVRLGRTFDVFRYIDGLGRTIQERHTAESDASTPTVDRYRVTGWQIFNHKGLVVEAFQPQFSTTSAYALGTATAARVTTSYDPLGRPLRVDHPDGTFETTTYHPWVQAAADRNDNASGIASSDSRYGWSGGGVSPMADHHDTPTQTYVDALGRQVALAEDNGSAIHVTRTVYDLKDQATEVWDARGLTAATWTFSYDFSGRRLLASHLTAMGDRYSLPDAAANPIWSRDSRGVEVTRVFDIQNRPLTENSSDGTTKLRRAWNYVDYDEGSGHGDRQAKNLYGQVEEARDADGLRYFEYDHRGLVVQAHHRFWDVDWTNTAADVWTQAAAWDPATPSGSRSSISTWLALPGVIDTTTLTIRTSYDAAGRPIQVEYPEFDDSGTTRSMKSRANYNSAGLLLEADVDKGDGAWTVVVEESQYNERGQLVSYVHGNGVVTSREYDPDIERLTRVFTRLPGTTEVRFQDLQYSYDPVGNPTQIEDGLAGNAFKANQIIPNTRTFRYDPRYRLTGATGKKHATITQKSTNALVPSPDPNDYDPYDYVYSYDEVGNFTRNDEYATNINYKDGGTGRIDLFNGDNGEAGTFTAPDVGNFTYDDNGNTLKTPRHSELGYTFDNQPRYVDMGGGTEVRYLRHADQRCLRLVRKNGAQSLGVYLGLFELHSRRAGGSTAYTKHVLHLGGHGRHGQAETVTEGADNTSLSLFLVHSDHLGSGHVLTNSAGQLLSQEEYFPYGRSSDRRDARNRYRYIGVERDEDTGLCMTGPRTYDPVSGRFLQGDPLVKPHRSPYGYVSGRPIAGSDPGGYADPFDVLGWSDEGQAGERWTGRINDFLDWTPVPIKEAYRNADSILRSNGASSQYLWSAYEGVPQVNAGFNGTFTLLGRTPMFISVTTDSTGKASRSTVVHEAGHHHLFSVGESDPTLGSIIDQYAEGGALLADGTQFNPDSRLLATKGAHEGIISVLEERFSFMENLHGEIQAAKDDFDSGVIDDDSYQQRITDATDRNIETLRGKSPSSTIHGTSYEVAPTAEATSYAESIFGLGPMPESATDVPMYNEAVRHTQ